MAYAPNAWVVGELMVDEKHFDNSTQTRIFHQWYLQEVKRDRLMLDFNINTNISTMVMVSSGLCGMKCSLMKGGELGAQIIYLWQL
jgi:hypothetical protein